MRPRRDAIDAEPLAGVVKENVAGFDDRPMECDIPMTLLAPAAILAIAEPDAAGTVIRRRWHDCAVHQARNTVHDLEGRTRWIDALNRAIFQRVSGIGDEFMPRRRLNPTGEEVRVVGRMTRHR